MSGVPRLILGVFLAFAAAWGGVAAYAYFTLGRLTPVTVAATGEVLPPALSGLAEMGQRVYAANGCAYCHTQDIRPASMSVDIEKGLGPRRTVARDFLYRQPAMPGLLRMGQDLADYGSRAPAENEIHRHLFEPQRVVPGSIMPAYRFLYQTREISGQPAWDAVSGLSGEYAPRPGYEVVPTEEARALTAYLLSLRQNYPLPEASLR